MNATAAIFFLVLGQAADPTQAPGNAVVLPSHFETLASCEDAGEAARANNNGLYLLSYTCVPGSVNIEDAKTEVRTVSKSKIGLFALAAR